MEEQTALGSHKIVLSVNDVQNLVRKEFPNAVFTKVELDRGDGLYEYEADFYTPEVRGEMKFNPETGTVIEKEIKYTCVLKQEADSRIRPDFPVLFLFDSCGSGTAARVC